jgi:hypothetical protein
MGLLGSIGDIATDVTDSVGDTLSEGVDTVSDTFGSTVDSVDFADLGGDVLDVVKTGPAAPIEGAEKVAERVGLEGVADTIDRGQRIAEKAAGGIIGVGAEGIFGGGTSLPSPGGGGGKGQAAIPPDEQRAFNRWARRHPRAARAFKQKLQRV